jgi:plastocyanin
MRYVAILGIVCLGTLGTISGCSEDNPSPTGGAGGTGMSSSSSSGEAGAGGGGGMASSSSSSSSGGMMVHGCDSGTAQDETANMTVKITVGGAASVFSPACVRVKKGTMVTFEVPAPGNFSGHPLVGGLAGPPPAPDSSSPIQPTNTGTAVTFTMDLAGTYPFYCEYHAPSMAGAIFVE